MLYGNDGLQPSCTAGGSCAGFASLSRAQKIVYIYKINTEWASYAYARDLAIKELEMRRGEYDGTSRLEQFVSNAIE
jgi:hypothetical protein